MDCESHIGLALPAPSLGFRPEFLDFRRGIRGGKLEDNERIDRILNFAPESECGQPFVTERWDRGGLLARDWLPAVRGLHHEDCLTFAPQPWPCSAPCRQGATQNRRKKKQHIGGGPLQARGNFVRSSHTQEGTAVFSGCHRSQRPA
jgi:hypothetical protein